MLGMPSKLGRAEHAETANVSANRPVQCPTLIAILGHATPTRRPLRVRDVPPEVLGTPERGDPSARQRPRRPPDRTRPRIPPRMTAPLPDVVLFTRTGCHLCDEAREILRALLAERAAQGRPAPRLLERDIETDPALHDAFFTTIPVIEVGDRRLELATSPARIRRLLDDALADADAADPSADAIARPGSR